MINARLLVYVFTITHLFNSALVAMQGFILTTKRNPIDAPVKKNSPISFLIAQKN